MPISADLQLVLTMLLLPLVGWLWREGHSRLKAVEDRQLLAERELAAFRLLVAREYASLQHVREVENRFLDDLGEIKGTLKEIHRALIAQRTGAAE
ncbi:MAG: hypothetical protein J0H82_06305 [Alphaproteobacteria bacterium]|jgi:hypothetical protein|nr:hypothetical protein [Alphaproteobacteria bacterium]